MKILENNGKHLLINIKNNNGLWLNNLKLVEKYIIENNKIPFAEHKNKEIKQLGCWLLNQKQNYKNNDYIMKYENIRK